MDRHKVAACVQEACLGLAVRDVLAHARPSDPIQGFEDRRLTLLQPKTQDAQQVLQDTYTFLLLHLRQSLGLHATCNTTGLKGAPSPLSPHFSHSHYPRIRLSGNTNLSLNNPCQIRGLRADPLEIPPELRFLDRQQVHTISSDRVSNISKKYWTLVQML